MDTLMKMMMKMMMMMMKWEMNRESRIKVETLVEMKTLLDMGMKMRQVEIPEVYLLKLKLMKVAKLVVQLMESEVQVDWVAKME